MSKVEGGGRAGTVGCEAGAGPAAGVAAAVGGAEALAEAEAWGVAAPDMAICVFGMRSCRQDGSLVLGAWCSVLGAWCLVLGVERVLVHDGWLQARAASASALSGDSTCQSNHINRGDACWTRYLSCLSLGGRWAGVTLRR